VIVNFYDAENGPQFLFLDIFRAKSENGFELQEFLFGTNENIAKNPFRVAVFAFFGRLSHSQAFGDIIGERMKNINFFHVTCNL